jgi:hypothetical protein
MVTKSMVLGAVLAVSAGVASAQNVQLLVKPHSAVNYFGSPSYNAYEANVMTGLLSGVSAMGDRSTDPLAYQLLNTNANTLVAPGEMMVTGYPSWRGVAGPTGALTSELGNRMTFSLTALGATGADQFSLRQIGFEMDGVGTGGPWDYGYVPFAGYAGANPQDDTLFPTGYDYQPWQVGVQYGADNALGGGDDIILNNGQAGSTLVNAVYYFGVGDAYWADFACTGPGGNAALCDTAAERQGLLDAAAADMTSGQSSPFFLKGTYYINTQAGVLSAAATVSAIPEPAELGMLIAGLGIVAGVARRRHNRSSK